jgi:hypothetical protein
MNGQNETGRCGGGGLFVRCHVDGVVALVGQEG